ncbi:MULTISPECIES: MbtH family protein [Streptomyces]|uniref:MbtH family protein n=2 Tax=Streptomyces rimosus subsp. rimosus TaxID=132474 RepID=L8EYH6_STRR1|nr:MULTISPECIES: MbtH family protein [Streptomyces]KOG54034.1 protein mbtH [Streptomyces griseoflavus]KOG68740.1 protein mbtH [Kitasatospora aureofaciens]KWT58294.1 protein mbtH [Streptomyces albus subsp. albus]MYT47439.1 MbtH family NRPS accessory protein [Streptomyces sp. SID5471]KEF07884.1 protein mbtH [Streptomyces rimosus]
MANPFDNEDGTFHVLVNGEGQHSIWPVFADVPAGWTITLEARPRAEALAAVERDWTDMRPKSLVTAHAGS